MTGKRRFAGRTFRLDSLEDGEYVQLYNGKWFVKPPASWAAMEVEKVLEHRDGSITVNSPIGSSKSWFLVSGKWEVSVNSSKRT